MNRRLGFTVVEMVVVIATLVIIAAITVVGYGSWETRMIETQLKNDLTQASSAMEDARTKDGTYPGALPTGFATSDGVTVTVVRATGDHFCLEAESANQPGNKWTAENDTDAKAGSCPSLRFTAIDAGVAHTCAIADGKAYCWGFENYGQTGRGVTATSGNGTARPVLTTLMSGPVSDIAAGSTHSCAVSSAKVYCWGANGSGQLGNGQTVDTNTPVMVNHATLPGVVTEVKASSGISCALSSGMAYCWGTNFYRSLGVSNSNGPYTTPVALPTIPMNYPVTQISPGVVNSCGVGSGQIYCWGVMRNYLSTGTPLYAPTEPTPYPMNMSPISGQVNSISVDSFESNGDNVVGCASTSDEIYCWGNTNQFPYSYNQPKNQNGPGIPVVLPRGEIRGKITKVTVGGTFACAIAGGKAYCWGSGLGLGTGSSANNQLPTAVNTDIMKGKVTDISAGASHTCAIADGEPYCWGMGGNRQLGSGYSTANALVPVKVQY